jgi:hypothetical protein
VYVDDILAVLDKPQELMDMLSRTYKVKAGSVGKPTDYLGATKQPGSGNDTLPTDCWSLSPNVYVKRAVADVERTLDEIGQKLKTKVTSPLSAGYRPELHATPKLVDRKTNYFQGLIGVLQLIVKLGRLYINVGVALLSQFLAALREGHLEEVFHVFAHLKAHDRSSLVFDPRPFPQDPCLLVRVLPGCSGGESSEHAGTSWEQGRAHLLRRCRPCRLPRHTPVTYRNTNVFTKSSGDVVFKTPKHHGSIYFWLSVQSSEDWHQTSRVSAVQATDDGNTYQWPNQCLHGQPVGFQELNYIQIGA